MQNSERIRAEKKRDFEPQHLLMRIAENALQDAEKKIDGWKNQEIIAITFAALTVEALANSFGSKLNLNSNDFEKSSPTRKLEIICEELNIPLDWSTGHWATIWWLSNFRNKIAHPQPQPVSQSEIISLKKFHYTFHQELPPSDLENEITLGKAQNAVKAIDEIKWLFLSKDKCKQFASLCSDGFSGKASAIV